MTSSKSRRPCSHCGRVHSSSRSEAACKASSSSKSRTKSRGHHHHYHHHHHHRSGTATGTGTTTREHAHRATAAKADVESGRHPSSSLGPGFPDPVLITVMVILAISSIVMLVVGIWLLVVSNGWPLGLNFIGNIAWTRLISYGMACLLVGILLIPVIILALAAAQAKQGGRARVTRLFAVFLAALVVLILLMMSVTGILFATIGGGFMESIVREGWVNTAEDDRRFLRLCRLQSRYSCEGWELNSCQGCRPTLEGVFGDCSSAQREICPRCWRSTSEGAGTGEQRVVVVRQETSDSDGCREFVLRRYRQFFIPFTVYTIFLTLLLVLLAWKTCIDSTYRT